LAAWTSSSEESLKRADELLEQVAAHGESFGYEVPCLLIAAKDDEESNPSCITNSARVLSDFLDSRSPMFKISLGLTGTVKGGHNVVAAGMHCLCEFYHLKGV